MFESDTVHHTTKHFEIKKITSTKHFTFSLPYLLNYIKKHTHILTMSKNTNAVYKTATYKQTTLPPMMNSRDLTRLTYKRSTPIMLSLLK